MLSLHHLVTMILEKELELMQDLQLLWKISVLSLEWCCCFLWFSQAAESFMHMGGSCPC